MGLCGVPHTSLWKNEFCKESWLKKMLDFEASSFSDFGSLSLALCLSLSLSLSLFLLSLSSLSLLSVSLFPPLKGVDVYPSQRPLHYFFSKKGHEKNVE